MKKLLLFGLALLLLGTVPALYAQTVSGNIAVTVQDKSGAAVPKASVTAVNTATGFTKSGTANDQGELLFADLPLGSYNVTVTAAGFAKNEKTNFPVQLNRTNSATFILDVQTQSVTVEVTGAPPPINTTTAQLEGTFETRETADLPSATIGLGVINLALLAPGVTTSGGVGYGTGPSVGGQRPTNNSFTIEGVDNNNKGVTGPVVTVPNDAVAEFSTLQNDYSPEFGHSNGGQFNQTIVTGTNSFHGKLYEYNQNRYLDATDQQAIVAGTDPQRPRFDFNRVGGQLGGPIIKDKLFFFANGEYDPLGQASIPAGGLCTPTAAGYTALAGLAPGPNPSGAAGNLSLNATNLGILQTYLAPAPTGGNCPFTQGNTASGAITNPLYVCTGGAVNGGTTPCPTGNPVAVDVGLLNVTGPNFSNTYFLVTGADYNMSSKDQFRLRYIYNKFGGIDAAAQLPTFFETLPQKFHLVAINEYHTFRPDLTNEFRLGFNRFTQFFSSGNFAFPGLDVFPNLEFFDINAQLGPDPNAPQFAIQNVYQVSENLNWSHKNHNVRVGVEARRYISPQSFTQRARGDYNYTSLGTYLYDNNPDFLAERSTGTLIYYGDLVDSAWYINDTWRIRPSISLNFGLRYEYATVPFGERLQSLNASSSIPGVIDFHEPRAPKNQFMPRAGFAWSPDKNRTWSIRGGIYMGYDILYDNLGLLSVPPQLGATVDALQNPAVPATVINNFLTNGGIGPGGGGNKVFVACMGCGTTGKTAGHGATALARQQETTAAQVPVNLNNPVAVSYSLGVQHVFAKNYTLEVRYLGTHGYHLPTQLQINKKTAQSPTNFLPTFLVTPSAATLAGLVNNLAAITGPNLLAACPAATAAAPGACQGGSGVPKPISTFVPSFVSGCSAVTGLATDGLLADGTPAPCFTSNITSFQSNGNSVYHGASAQLTRRFEHGLQLNLSYTFSHAIDDSTAALFSTVITPRRTQDFQNLNNDRSNSALDHRHRITLVAYYDLPYFKSGSWFRRNVLGNWFFAPVYTYQSGEFATIHGSADTNLNGDSAGDRVLLNSAGIANTGAAATRTCLVAGVVTVSNAACSSAATVAYTATILGVNTPAAQTARYIRTGTAGLEPNNGLSVLGRNTFLMRPINNIDFTLGKKFSVTEKLHLELQAQFLNFLNHPQYIAGSINGVQPVGYTSTDASNFLNPAASSSAFLNSPATFSSNPRTIQLAAKLVF